MRTILVFLVFFLNSSVWAQSNSQIIHNVAVNVITQTYVDLARATEKLKLSVENFVAHPSEFSLKQAQESWKEARKPWESSEAFLFGPVDALGIDPMLDTWPLNTDDLELVMRSSSSEITADSVRHLGSNVQGFHALEYLLFGDGIKSNTKSLSQFTPKQLQYLKATAFLLAEYSSQLANAWTTNYDPENPEAPGYVDVISNPSLNNPFYSSELAVLQELAQGMVGILDEVGSAKMGEPLGEDLASANPELVESPYSWNSLAELECNLQSVLHVYTGQYGVHRGPGLKDFVGRTHPQLANEVEVSILKAQQAISDISGPQRSIHLGQALLDKEGRLRVQSAIGQLNAVRDLVEAEVLPLIK